MRLGGYFGAESVADLEKLCEPMDVHGLSAISAPSTLSDRTAGECAEFGARARELGMVVGEGGMWSNIMTADPDARNERVETVRKSLRNADVMGCLSIVTLVGTRDKSDAGLAPHPYMYTDECRKEFRELVLRILDGIDLKTTKYIIEPWHNTFFYDPDDIKEFIDSVDHPAFGLHLDQMNMVSQKYFHKTTELINRTFDLLADKVFSVHLKDIQCDHGHMFLKWDEVNIGDGVMDYETYLKRLAALPPDTPCYCEHMAEERDYALNFARLHHIASKADVRFLRRDE
jgi:sugar phosphate isomerase/epimerase